ncbi:MAG TPA: hypothetical protein VGG68_10295 [Caulobacteraceae bacterium]|jgi:hypothetical protein
MPQFVQSVANQQTPPPYHFPGVTAHAFVIDIQMAAVQTYCDTYFNLGDERERGFVYRPFSVWPYALLMVVQYPLMINTNRTELGLDEIPFADRGYSSQNEVFLAVPLVRHGVTPQNLLLNAAIEWALPFIVVDNSTSAFSGREILGLEKLWGRIDLGSGQFPNGFSASVEIPGWSSLDPKAMQRMRRVLHITTGSPLPGVGHKSSVTSAWTMLESPIVLKSFQGLADAFDSLVTMSNGVIPTPMRLVALKQFRDAADPHRAIYQALVGARSKYYDIANLTLYNEQDVAITLDTSGSFAEIAKIFLPNTPGPATADPKVSIAAHAAFGFTANLDFDEMSTLHTFPVEGDDCASVDGGGAGMLSPWLRPWWGLINASGADPQLPNESAS